MTERILGFIPGLYAFYPVICSKRGLGQTPGISNKESLLLYYAQKQDALQPRDPGVLRPCGYGRNGSEPKGRGYITL